MSTRAKHNCKFFLLRYVPNVVKGEFVNFGLVLLPPQAPPELRFSKDWSRLESLDAQADSEWLDAFRDELRNELGKSESREEMLRRIQESFSNTLQASEYKACLTAAPAQEADELARIYLEAPRRRATREKGTRQKIYQSMKSAFSGVGVWKAMWKDIPASRYSRAGDPLVIDCGYQTNSTIKMFHAASLKSDITMAKVLAFGYPELAEGIRRKEHAQAHLTAIIEDGLERSEQFEFALETLDRAGIQVETVAALPGLAQRAAEELRIG